MPKQKLGTGNKRAVLQRPGTSYTSPNAIKLQQRRAAALDYRLQGRAYHWIAKALDCHPSTAHDYVVKALRDMVPRETAEAVLQLGLYPSGRNCQTHGRPWTQSSPAPKQKPVPLLDTRNRAPSPILRTVSASVLPRYT
jgi:hypothetical protein